MYMKIMLSSIKYSLASAALFFMLVPPAQAEIRLGKIPPPSSTSKLRVFVLAVSGLRTSGDWKRSHEDYTRKTVSAVRKFLNTTGIYEVIPDKEIQSVVETKEVNNRQWERDDWALALRAGNALHAEYVLVAERSQNGYFTLTLTNLETGVRFKSAGYPLRNDDHRDFIKESYRKLFRESRSDLLITALKKGRKSIRQETSQNGPVKAPEPQTVSKVERQT
ncbi:MAG: hypothetical protein L7F78_20140, partial [Syntrophales bacterium LBB04]|nr:hypothetical protein [Syntrophales bacterium LBB04]